MTATDHVVADDGTRLALHLTGPGEPLLCLPGGPMLDSAYLRDLGGLAAQHPLARLDLRGSGASQTADPATYRCDRQVADVEAVRRHLGLERLDLLAHSAGANLAHLYAQHHPERVASLTLLTPSPRAVGVEVAGQDRAAVVRARAGEPWYAEAAAAFERLRSGSPTDADWDAITPFTHGRWDAETQAYEAWMAQQLDPASAAAFFADGAFDPPATRAALAELDVPVLVLAGEHDLGNPPSAMAEVAGLFPQGRLVVQEGAGHFPWVDDPARFLELVAPAVVR